jgi:N-acetylglutamate synthase-like GNAT family acetyltransferase
LADLLIRPATRGDQPAIRSLIHAVGINPIGLSWRRFYVVDSENGDFLGCGQIKIHGDGSKELASIAVQENARGKGVASMIIKTLLIQDPERPLYLMCQAHLESFYNKFGFSSIQLMDMPRYFRHICRMVNIVDSRLPSDNRLRVMRLP